MRGCGRGRGRGRCRFVIIAVVVVVVVRGCCRGRYCGRCRAWSLSLSRVVDVGPCVVCVVVGGRCRSLAWLCVAVVVFVVAVVVVIVAVRGRWCCFGRDRRLAWSLSCMVVVVCQARAEYQYANSFLSRCGAGPLLLLTLLAAYSSGACRAWGVSQRVFCTTHTNTYRTCYL